MSATTRQVSEAALFYEAASVSLGRDFLEDLQQTIDTLRAHPPHPLNEKSRSSWFTPKNV